jgi:PhzF family phenazine biosynthesis protein
MKHRSVQIYQIDAFTDQLFTGNPAGVVLGAECLSDAEMQLLARELAHFDTAFVLPATEPGNDLQVRFFSPRHEVSFIGHATVAAHIARLDAGLVKPGTFRQITRNTLYDVQLKQHGERTEVSVEIPAPDLSAPIDTSLRRNLLDLFGMDSNALDPKCPIVITKRNTTRILIGIRSVDLLNGLNPDFEALKRLTPHIGADGYFLFVRDPHGPNTTESRLFSPALGLDEDPVSGNAHGMLGAYLVAHDLVHAHNGQVTLRGHQGAALNRPGFVDVTMQVTGGQATHIRMSGTGKIVFKTTLNLD